MKFSDFRRQNIPFVLSNLSLFQKTTLSSLRQPSAFPATPPSADY